jgi:hypothetical protein
MSQIAGFIHSYFFQVFRQSRLFSSGTLTDEIGAPIVAEGRQQQSECWTMAELKIRYNRAG